MLKKKKKINYSNLMVLSKNGSIIMLGFVFQFPGIKHTDFQHFPPKNLIEWDYLMCQRQTVSFETSSVILSELDKTYEKIYDQGWKHFCALYLDSSYL